ncbi:MAG: ABC transporter ATP-binding protein, partial [Devosia sp.]|nr:ABC transporter ATP-binding protein [Devosia sp.]
LELYKKPAHRFVAGFIGSPRMNFVDGAEAAKHHAHSIGVRPEHFTISTTAGAGLWKGKVAVAEQLGSDTFLHVNVEGLGLMTIRADGDQTFAHGDALFLTPDPARIYKFDAAGKAI